MKDQHTHIKGYRDLTQAEIDLMNRIKAEGERINDLIVDLDTAGGIDQLWLYEGRMDLQKGIMCLVRSVARPNSF